jgi:hypothetical protein
MSAGSESGEYIDQIEKLLQASMQLADYDRHSAFEEIRIADLLGISKLAPLRRDPSIWRRMGLARL